MQPDLMLTHYRIGPLIGKGGMGEVYRAHDTKLGRDVALKILPSELAADADRLARFQREAKVLASLNHPNIASIYGFEAQADRTFLVMELVEGEDLAAIIQRGPLPVDEAVGIMCQIAEGLEEAHEKGIVHRDLKPANVKRTGDGKVKVLDFGLARAMTGQGTGEEFDSGAPTMTAVMTQVGAVVGTAAYMSPEQARGQVVDRRTDIWAFGVILFELLTGRQLFAGETASDTLAEILKSEPDWDLLPDGLPYHVERVLRRCLAKDPRQRLRDIGEARIRLKDPQAESALFSGQIAAVPGPARRAGWKGLLPWGLFAASLAVAGWFAFLGPRAPEPGPLHLAFLPPADADFHIGGSFPGLPEISPDGGRVVFSAIDHDDNTVMLYVRALDQVQPVPLGDTRDAQYPFWSPDGRWIGFYARSEGLMKIMADGGPPQLVCAATNGKGGSWNRTDDILFTTDYNTSIFTVKASGGEARAVTDLKADDGFNSHRHPQFMPDGRHFLYLARGAGRVESEVRFASLDGGPAKVVTQSDMMAYYASGHLLYVSHGALMARPFDPASGELLGAPTLLVEDVVTIPGAAKAAFSVSGEGSLTYLRGDSAQDASLSWRDRRGAEIGKVGDLAPYDMVSLSPDGTNAGVGIVDVQAGTWDLWAVDLERDFRTRLTFDPADEADIVWSRDGRSLYFTSDREGQMAVYRKEIGNPAPPSPVFGQDKNIRLWDVDSTGRILLYSIAGEGTAWDLWAHDLDKEGSSRLLYRSAEQEVFAKLSPDETWILFSSSESGQPQVFVAPWPDMAPVTQVSTTNGTWGAWTKGGGEIVFQEVSGRVHAVSIAPDGGRLRVGKPEVLFDMAPPMLEGVYWAATPDGERFLTVNAYGTTAPPSCNLVLNWPRLVQE